MLTVVDSLQECDKIKRVFWDLKSETFPSTTHQHEPSQDLTEIETPPVLIRIKPAQLAVNKVQVGPTFSSIKL